MSIVISKGQLYRMFTVFYIAACMIEQTKIGSLVSIGGFILIARLAIYVGCVLELISARSVNKWSVIFIPLLVALAVMVFFNSDKQLIVDLLAILWLNRNGESEGTVKSACYIELALLLMVIFLSLIGVIENTAKVRYGLSTVRYGLGFNYTTYSANYFYHIILALAVIKKDNFKIIHLAALEILNYIIYLQTDTKAVFYLASVFLFTVYIIKFFHKPLFEFKVLDKILPFMVFICCGISFWACVSYDSGDARWVALDSMLSGRLRLSYQAFQEYSFTLLGQLITWNTGLTSNSSSNQAYFYVDSSFLNIAFVYGLIVLILVCFAFFFLLRKAVKEDNKWLCLAIIFLLLHSITDPQLIEIRYDLLLLYLSPMLQFARKTQRNNDLDTSDKRGGATRSVYGNDYLNPSVRQ